MKKNTINTTEAAEILHLPAYDPIISLYTGIELFEAGNRQQALAHFVIAAEHYYLPAIPYLQTLTLPREKLVINAELQKKIASINLWATWLTECDLSFKSHYQASMNKINRTPLAQLLAADPSNKNAKRNLRDLDKELLQGNTIHFFYQLALYYFEKGEITSALTHMANAASLGHLLATAYFVQKKMTPKQAHANVKALCDTNLHQSQQSDIFAKRLLLVAEHAVRDDYRLLLLNTLAQCGDPFALSMWTELLSEKNPRNPKVHPLIAIGVLRNNTTAIFALSRLVANRIPIRLPGFDASPTTTLNLLVTIIRAQSAETAQDHHFKVARHYFAMVLNQLTSEPEIYNNDALIALCEKIIADDKESKPNYVAQLCDSLANMYLQRVFSTEDLQQQSHYRQKTIHCLKTGWELTDAPDFLRNLFFITYEANKSLLKNPDSDPALKEPVQNQLNNYITLLDQRDEGLNLTEHLGNDYIKYIDYCAENLRRAVNSSPEADNNLVRLYRKYLVLAANAKNPDFIESLAICYFAGKHGFPINYKKAQQLLLSLPKESLEAYNLLFLTAQTYLNDTPCQSDKALQLLIKYADRFPRFYFDLAEFYADGHIGIAPNRNQALAYYHKAIELGVAEAYVGLGIFKWEDEAVTEAMQLFQLAYDAKCADGAFFMGKMYLEGNKDVPSNLARAKKCFQDAISFNRQPSAKAFLTMMEAGYAGEKPIPLKYLIIKQQVLSEFDYQENSASAMLELGLLYLNFDLDTAIAYITRAAKYNNINAQYFLAILNNFLSLNLFVIDPAAIKQLQAHNYPELMEANLAPQTSPAIKDLFQFIKLINHYQAKNYQITTDYIQTLLKTELFGSGIDFDIIEDDIKQRFAPPEIKQILILAQKFSEHETSGDHACQKLTEKLLASSRSQQQNFQRKLSKIRDSGQVSMQNISHCLSAFLATSGNTSKAIKAAVHIHPPHGRDDRNAHQPMEGGRAKTAFAAIDEMLNSNNRSPSPSLSK